MNLILICMLKTELMKEVGVTDGNNNYWDANCHYVSTGKAFS
jgi:hypothetical protein